MPPIFGLIQEQGGVSEEEMYDVFNMGCGFCVVVPASDEAAALSLLRAALPGAQRIGRAVEGRPGSVRRPIHESRDGSRPPVRGQAGSGQQRTCTDTCAATCEIPIETLSNAP